MYANEKIKKWIEEHEGVDYCKCNDECGGSGVVGGPDGPIYPPCVDTDIEELLDTEALLEDMEY